VNNDPKVALRDYVDLRIGQERELRSLQIAATEKALILAKDTREYVEKAWYEKRDKMLEDRLSSLENSRSKQDGRMATWAVVLVLIELALASLAFLIKK